MLSGLFLISVSSALMWAGTAQYASVDVKKESMSLDDAKMFPVVGSGVLVGLFFALRYFPKDLVNTIFRAIFSITGTFSMYKALKIAYSYVGARASLQKPSKEKTDEKTAPKQEGAAKKEAKEKAEEKEAEAKKENKPESLGFIANTWASFKSELAESADEIKEIFRSYAQEFREMPNGLLFVASILISVWYFKTKSMHSSNILACSFALMGMQEIRPESAMTAMVLLGLLFFYDIFWVFFTPVMMGVAKGLEIPIKIVYPFSRKGTSMIGLGDIVIPGLFLSLAREFSHKYSAPLVFALGYVGYVLSLVLTFSAVLIFGTGQPALLYICPIIVAGSLVGAAIHKRTRQFIEYKSE
ncbi:minor histocompatibility antigen H13 [Nematocida major]|uniref:minor histocompatibility antigen H13 n=1 Tax=Nematocida major TaxID=1912982 RepID=UPI002008BBD1|nr:minor histocompatibility antigen H13 [Nematocida major]KAH9386000.1 minor histocompatibility antigen H13 [Nematocida major]